MLAATGGERGRRLNMRTVLGCNGARNVHIDVSRARLKRLVYALKHHMQTDITKRMTTRMNMHMAIGSYTSGKPPHVTLLR